MSKYPGVTMLKTSLLYTLLFLSSIAELGCGGTQFAATPNVTLNEPYALTIPRRDATTSPVVTAIAFHPNCKIFAAAYDDNHIRLWDVASRTVAKDIN